ncbi:MAG: hypothetical protein WBN23_11505, partial [Woeseia sp.]
MPGQRDGDSGERPKTHDAVLRTAIDDLSESRPKSLGTMLPARSGNRVAQPADRVGFKRLFMIFRYLQIPYDRLLQSSGQQGLAKTGPAELAKSKLWTKRKGSRHVEKNYSAYRPAARRLAWAGLA